MYLFFGDFGPGFRSDDARLHFRQLYDVQHEIERKTK